jgi:hypothetical protein
MHTSNVLYQGEDRVFQCTVYNAHIFSETTEGTLINFGTAQGGCSIRYDIYLLQIGVSPGGNKIILKEFTSGSNKDGARVVPDLT